MTSSASSASISTPSLTKYALWIEPRDVWCIKLDPIWIDFLGARSIGPNKAVPFVDAVPITFWIHGRSSDRINVNSIDSLKMPSLASFERKLQDCYINDERNSNTADYTHNADYYSQTNPFHAGDKEMGGSDSVTLNAGSTGADDISTADLHIIAHVSNLVSAQIDHYQYLFLLRLAEEMTELSTFITIDSKRILQERDESKSVIVGLVVPQVEVTLVMPSQTPGKESTAGDIESVFPDSVSLGDDLHMNSVTNMSGASNWPVSLDQLKNHQNTLGSIETPSPITNEQPESVYQQFEQVQEMQYTSSPNTHGFNVRIDGNPSTNVVQSPPVSVAAQPTGGQSARSKNRNSVTEGSLNNFGSSLISMKKGFSSFMTSIDSALKTNMTDDMSDTISIQSDISSDSENFVMVLADDKTADCMDVMFRYATDSFDGIQFNQLLFLSITSFRLNPFTSDTNTKPSAVEIASEVCEENMKASNMSSPSEPSEASTWRRRDLVSMVTFRLTTVEVIRQNRGPLSSIRVQVAAVSCDECAAIPWDELQVLLFISYSDVRHFFSSNSLNYLIFVAFFSF